MRPSMSMSPPSRPRHHKSPGQSVQIEWSENLADWEVLLNTDIGPEGKVTVEDPDSPDREKRFYRVLFSD